LVPNNDDADNARMLSHCYHIPVIVSRIVFCLFCYCNCSIA